MTELESHLYRKKRTLLEACKEFGIDLEEACTPNLECCSHCSIWYKHSELIQDLDGNPICKVCDRFYGL